MPSKSFYVIIKNNKITNKRDSLSQQLSLVLMKCKIKNKIKQWKGRKNKKKRKLN